MEVSVWFIVVFVIMWAIGPATQVLQLIAPKLHFKLGLMEKAAFEPEFKWFLLEQRGIAYADLTFCFTAIVFVWLAIAGSKTALIFGLYTSACYVYFATLYAAGVAALHLVDRQHRAGGMIGNDIGGAAVRAQLADARAQHAIAMACTTCPSALVLSIRSARQSSQLCANRISGWLSNCAQLRPM